MKTLRQGLAPRAPAKLSTLAWFAVVALAVISDGVAAEEGVTQQELEQIELSLTEVDGTRQYTSEEEPRVLHIVPWQQPSVRARDRQMPAVEPRDSLLQPIGADSLRGYRNFRIIGNGTGASPPG